VKKETEQIIRVLLVSRSFEHHGGVVNYVQLLLKYSDPGLIKYDHVVVGKSSPTSPFWRRPFEYAVSLVRFILKLLSLKPDLVHLNPSLSWRSLPLVLTLLIVTKVLSKSQTLLFFRGWDDAIAVAMIKKKLLGRFIRLMLSLADYYLVLSNAFRERLVAAGFPTEKISVSSVMVETEKFIPSTRLDHEIKKENNYFNVLYLSRLERAKGIWHVMDAMDWLHQFCPTCPIRLIIAGEGTERESLVKAIDMKQWKDRVEFAGYVRGEEKYETFKKSDLFIFPSAHPEGFPNAVLEALAAGLPIIYTPVGVLNEILGPQNGIRMKLDDLSGENLAKHIWVLHSDRERCQDMAIANRRMAEERFDVSVVCRRMAAIYQKILNDHQNEVLDFHLIVT
jgi:glycosyltransferase involved in cell wall biosynthesis